MKLQKKARGELASKTARKLIARAEYHAFALRTTGSGKASWSFQQRRAPQRRCVACGRFVGNSNLGGHGGRSALSGPLWCYDCAHYPRQCVLNFGSIG